MTRHATVRLVAAMLVTATGGLLAVMTGRTDAALLASPWVMLLALGLAQSVPRRATGSVVAEPERVLSGDLVTVRTRLSGVAGWVDVTIKPDQDFLTRPTGEPPTPDPAGNTAHDAADNTAHDAADGTAQDDSSSLSATALARSGRPLEVTCEVTAAAWGTHDLGRVDIEVSQPYGLVRMIGSLHTPSPVRVHPQPTELDDLVVPWLVRRRPGAHDSPATGQGVEFADLRPFRAGDSLRDINWRASARNDDLWVSQRHPDQSTEVVLFLDSFTESGHDVRTVLGLAVEAAMAVAENHLGVTDRVGLVEMGGIVRWITPRTGRLHLQRLIDALLATRLYENWSERDLAIIPTRALPPASLVVAVSPLLDDRFVQTLHRLRSAGHDVVVIECPPIVGPGRDPAGLDASSGVARKLWQAERAMTVDRLAARGVAVGRWRVGEPVSQVVVELNRRRRVMRASVQR